MGPNGSERFRGVRGGAGRFGGVRGGAGRFRGFRAVLGAGLVAAVALGAQDRPRPSTASGEWPTYGGDLASTKYSPLS